MAARTLIQGPTDDAASGGPVRTSLGARPRRIGIGVLLSSSVVGVGLLAPWLLKPPTPSSGDDTGAVTGQVAGMRPEALASLRDGPLVIRPLVSRILPVSRQQFETMCRAAPPLTAATENVSAALHLLRYYGADATVPRRSGTGCRILDLLLDEQTARQNYGGPVTGQEVRFIDGTTGRLTSCQRPDFERIWSGYVIVATAPRWPLYAGLLATIGAAAVYTFRRGRKPVCHARTRFSGGPSGAG